MPTSVPQAGSVSLFASAPWGLCPSYTRKGTLVPPRHSGHTFLSRPLHRLASCLTKLVRLSGVLADRRDKVGPRALAPEQATPSHVTTSLVATLGPGACGPRPSHERPEH